MEPDQTRALVLTGLVAVAVTELALVVFGRREWLLPVTAVAVALVVFLLRQTLSDPGPGPADAGPSNGQQEVLDRWLARAALLASWADGTREDWDLHLRPLLAREFTLAVGIARNQDPGAYRAAAAMVFGPELWVWVDPDNNAKSQRQRSEPAPGREVYGELLRRLEAV